MPSRSLEKCVLSRLLFAAGPKPSATARMVLISLPTLCQSSGTHSTSTAHCPLSGTTSAPIAKRSYMSRSAVADKYNNEDTSEL